MALTSYDLDILKMNQHAKYLGQTSSTSRIIIQTRTRPTDCSTWATKMVRNCLNIRCTILYEFLSSLSFSVVLCCLCADVSVVRQSVDSASHVRLCLQLSIVN